jgi:UDP-N-acetylmuramate--alanine ligase
VVNIVNIQKVYFIGIGGIGMSNLARYFAAKGATVGGYDKTSTALTQALEAEGMSIHYTEDVTAIPQDAELVVYTPAIPAEHAELVYYQQHGYPMLKRSQVLGAIMRHSYSICVAGTHGKTTTTTMVAHILRHSGYGCNAFLGGIAANYNSNFWTHPNNVCVAEADEYDRSFLQLDPDVAVITSIDPDHLDIYGTVEAMEQAFVDFSKRLKPGGLLISKHGLKQGDRLQGPMHITYSGSDSGATVHAANVVVQQGGYRFDVVLPGTVLEGLTLNMGGLHNVENVVAAIAVAHHLQIDADKIRAAVASFRGVKRRFEYITDATADPVMIDDYAHHPEELRALINGARGLFPSKKCTVVFQPHLYSRTNDLATEFAAVLDLADEVVLLPIYPARELPMPGVASEMILERMRLAAKQVLGKEALMGWLAGQQPEMLITAGAGDIDTLVEPIRQILTKRKQ